MNAIELTEDLQARTGLGEKEARGIVRVILQAVEDATAQLVTRDHLGAGTAEVRAEIQAFRADMYREFLMQTRWLTATMLAVGGFVVAAIKLI